MRALRGKSLFALFDEQCKTENWKSHYHTLFDVSSDLRYNLIKQRQLITLFQCGGGGHHLPNLARIPDVNLIRVNWKQKILPIPTADTCQKWLLVLHSLLIRKCSLHLHKYPDVQNNTFINSTRIWFFFLEYALSSWIHLISTSLNNACTD